MIKDLLLMFITVLPATIAAIAGLIVSIKTDKRAKDIHVIVNGNIELLRKELVEATVKSERISEDLNEANERIQVLLNTLQDKNEFNMSYGDNFKR